MRRLNELTERVDDDVAAAADLTHVRVAVSGQLTRAVISYRPH